jgi:ATP-dependent Clp protease adapter protein ClpS
MLTFTHEMTREDARATMMTIHRMQEAIVKSIRHTKRLKKISDANRQTMLITYDLDLAQLKKLERLIGTSYNLGGY